MGDRFVLLGLARARAGWFQTVGQWATSASLPAEFVRCVSAEEVRARLGSGRPFSAALVAADAPGLDRDLVAEAAAVGCAVLVVDEGAGRDWRGLGAAATLATPFSRDELLELLEAHARPVGREVVDEAPRGADEATNRGRLIAVTGPGGTGASTVAIALAQGLARDGTHGRRRRRREPTRRPAVLLADLCRHADLAMLHDSRRVVPGLQEVVEAHRAGAPSPATVREQTFEVPARGYRLLLGLRRSHHWVGLRPRAVAATLDTLQRAAQFVVADVEPDVEGEAETGSIDVEDRHLLARAALARADAAVIVGEPSMKGLYALVRTLTDLLAFGVDVSRVVPVLTRAPRQPRTRAELVRTFAELAGTDASDAGAHLAAPTFLPERRVDDALRDGVALPSPLPELTAGAVTAVLGRADGPPVADAPVPEPIAPGSLSGFTSQERPQP